MNQKKITIFENSWFWVLLFLLTLAIAWFFLPPEVPLYYSQALAEARLAKPYHLLIFPFFVLILSFLKNILIKYLALENKIMINLISRSVQLITIVSYLVFLRIILIVL